MEVVKGSEEQTQKNELHETEVTFKDVKTGKEATIKMVPEEDDKFNITFDFGEEGAAAHKGTYIAIMSNFAQFLGINVKQ